MYTLMPISLTLFLGLQSPTTLNAAALCRRPLLPTLALARWPEYHSWFLADQPLWQDSLRWRKTTLVGCGSRQPQIRLLYQAKPEHIYSLWHKHIVPSSKFPILGWE